MTRIERERRTVSHMVAIYCRAHHAARGSLCEPCAALHRYAMARLDHCVYGDGKPTCKQCPVHCYRKEMRAAMRDVMRYAGPRMILSHPYLAIRHLLDERSSRPARPSGGARRAA
jgi:hypothetical protein